MKPDRESLIQDFVRELSGFARSAEVTLAEIEKDLEKNKGHFQVFAGMMLTIRGTAQQLGFDQIAQIAVLGEEIAVKAVDADSRSKIRKCVGSLWDVITSVKFLIEHHQQGNFEEQQILLNRLEYTLNAFGGSRDKVDQSEVERLLQQRG